MSKIDHLQKMLSDIAHQIRTLNQLIIEKKNAVETLEKNLLQIESTISAEKLQLTEYEAQLNGALEMKTETDRYYNQIEQNIDTLMTILTTSRT